MKTATEIAKEILDTHFRGVRSDITDVALIAWMTRAIEADRSERGEGDYSVIATVGKDNPEALVGTYRSEFEAVAVCKEWNRINNKHHVTYRVEKDW